MNGVLLEDYRLAIDDEDTLLEDFRNSPSLQVKDSLFGGFTIGSQPADSQLYLLPFHFLTIGFQVCAAPHISLFIFGMNNRVEVRGKALVDALRGCSHIDGGACFRRVAGNRQADAVGSVLYAVITVFLKPEDPLLRSGVGGDLPACGAEDAFEVLARGLVFYFIEIGLFRFMKTRARFEAPSFSRVSELFGREMMRLLYFSKR